MANHRKRKLPPSHPEQFPVGEEQPASTGHRALNTAAARRAAPAEPALPTAGPKPARPRHRHWLARRLAAALALLLLLGGGALGLYLHSATQNDGLWLELEQLPGRDATILYASDGAGGWVEYTRLSPTQEKEWVDLAQVPADLQHAFVAVEDRHFYSHSGVSWKRTAFALLNELKYKLTGSYIGGEEGTKQGASTIDQQLIKNLTRDDEAGGLTGYLRKLREIWRALRLDARYDKDTILEAYLNVISFTGNTAGVQAESQKLFGKPVSQLTTAQCASIACITKNPSRYNPVTHPDLHLERRNYLLWEMWQQGYLSQEAYTAACAEELGLAPAAPSKRDTPVTSYFTDALLRELSADLGQQLNLTGREATFLLYDGGLRIYTTVQPSLQTAMERVMASGVFPQPSIQTVVAVTDEAGAPLYNPDGTPATTTQPETPQAAMLSLDHSGGVAAVVGGLGEKTISRGLNRAVQSTRQPGSTMKAIGAYALALESDAIHWSSPFLDAPVRQLKDPDTGQLKDWPANYSSHYSQENILVADALAQSINTIAVRVGQRAGNLRIYAFATGSLGITSFGLRDLATAPLVLGASTHGVSPQELAAAYQMFGTGGLYTAPHTYTSVQLSTGSVLLEQAPASRRVMDEETAYVVNRLLRGVLHGNGTAAGYACKTTDSIGKTGTSTANKDFWFVGLTPYYTTAVWYGYDSAAAMPAGLGAGPVCAAWQRTMDAAQADLPPLEFPVSDTVLAEEYCTQTGLLAGDGCPHATGYYKPGALPALCTAHG